MGVIQLTSHPMLRSVPQGFNLSSLLFNVLLSNLQVPRTSHILVYMNDITIVTRVPFLAEVQAHLQEAAEVVSV